MMPPEIQIHRPHRPFSSTPTFPTFSPDSQNPSPNYPSSKNPRLNNNNPSPFLHNTRLLLALIPCAIFLLDLGGTPVIITLTLGLMTSYILDSLNLKQPSFFTIWFSLLISQFAFFFTSNLTTVFNSIPLGVIALLFCAKCTFLIGVWASLQFKWIQIENPSIVVALERVLFACVPLTATGIFTWGVVSAVGMNNAGYYLMVFGCVNYWLFSVPRVSSFKSRGEVGFHGGEIPEENMILGPLESCVHSLSLMFFPLSFHVASHYNVLLGNVSDLFLLFFVPFLFQLYASTRGALWWITKSERDIRSIRVVNGAVALVVVVICLEIRVVFHSFGRYIQVPSPLNYVLVTVTMLGGALAFGAYAVGLIGDAFSSIAFTAMSVLVSGAGAIVIGFPIMFLPLPLICGFYLARFFTKKSLPSYFAFVLLASLMVVWFVLHNFWDLNIWLAGMSLKSFSKLVVANVILAMAVPGLALFPRKFRFLTEIGLVSHALLLCHIENQFFNYSNIYYFGMDDDVMYPSYMVVTTTFVGLALARKLVVDCCIGPKTFWILTCLYSSKLSMLFITSKSVVWVSAVLLLAISPPLLLYKDRAKTASKMKAWQGYTHAAVITLSTWFCRETVFEVLQWWYGKPPSDGLLLGFFIILSGLACIPIVALHFSHVQSAKRCLVLVVAMGLLFILLQPPIQLSWAFHSDLIRAAHQSADDISIYGFVASKPTWPSWLLIVAILLTLAAVTSIIPVKYMVEMRTFYALGVGCSLGIYISVEYFLQATILQAFIVVIVVCTSIFVVFTHFPSASSIKFLPWVFGLLVSLFPVTYLLEGQLRGRNVLGEGIVGEALEEDNKLLTILTIEGARTSLLGLYAAIFMLIALEIKFELASLLREKLVDRGLTPNRSGRSNSANFPPKMRFMQQRRVSTVPTFTIKRLAAEGLAVYTQIVITLKPVKFRNIFV
ncbi:hypothetical protein IFM89_004401 [Coptis chinensis]|uniref:No exine formation 1 n=1 Tax=Coptis chinensis TaxID=261450 RepID=A0A835M482_9MAGN|nr:hypothetical protein IFM89_004401 [Coptis chinensis]